MRVVRLLLITITLLVFNSISAQEVYRTKTGEKYHTNSCRYLKYSKFKLDLKKALEMGFSACSVCKPPTKISKTSSIKSNLTSEKKTTEKPKTTKKSVATQCTGRTKAGKRCKRMTKSSNGRCYQH